MNIERRGNEISVIISCGYKPVLQEKRKCTHTKRLDTLTFCWAVHLERKKHEREKPQKSTLQQN